MVKSAIIFVLVSILLSSHTYAANSITLKPQASSPSFNVSYIQNLGSCSYSVIITTSCSSTKYTRDQISISFGDAYGNQIYAPRIDDPSTRAFERCSSDSFQINGPCAYQICYVYLYRTGPDGWMPDSVKIFGHNTRSVTFVYRTFIPSDIWYGFDLCHGASSSLKQSAESLLLLLIMGFLLHVFL